MDDQPSSKRRSSREPSAPSDADAPRIKPQADPRLSRSMEFGLAILECFSEQRPALGIAQLASIVGISRSTVHRYATTLVVLGYLEQDSKRKYQLARRAAAAGDAAIGAMRLRGEALAILEALRERTGHTVSTGILDRGRALYVQRLLTHREGQYEVDRNFGVGVPLPLHCSAIGKALLACLPENELAERLENIEFTRHGPHTIASRRGLLAELERIREQGFALSDEELLEGARSIAVVAQRVRVPPLAIEVTVPAGLYTVQELVIQVAPHLQSAATLISNE